MNEMSSRERMLRACRCQPVDVVPVWLMRQAGRYMSEYGELKGTKTFQELIESPDLSFRIAAAPVTKFGMDAAIVFSDLPLILQGMGARVTYSESGPVLGKPITSPGDLPSLRRIEPDSAFPALMEEIRLLRESFPDKALIGFTGGPFTLATYVIEGRGDRDAPLTKAFASNHRATYDGLMEMLAEASADLLKAQARAGVDIVQVFDTWAGALTSEEYADLAFPYAMSTVSEAKHGKVPVIYFTRFSIRNLSIACRTGADVMSVDWSVDLLDAARIVGPRMSIQGNLDPATLLLNGGRLGDSVADIVSSGMKLPGYIFNLGHGVLPHTPEDNVRILVEEVRKRGRRAS